jgi:hypothetical protein
MRSSSRRVLEAVYLAWNKRRRVFRVDLLGAEVAVVNVVGFALGLSGDPG